MKLNKLLVIGLILLLLVFTANANAEGWSTTDKALGAATAALLVVDWRQTRMIANNPDRFYERNNLLGEHPTVAQVNRHFLISGIVIAGLAHFIPEYRTEILSIYVGYQTVNTIRNYNIGLRVRF